MTFVWVASGRSIHIPEVTADVWVPEYVSYIYDAFTFPASRGRGLMRMLLERVACAREDLRPSGHRCEAWVAHRNVASIRAFKSAGFEAREYFLTASVGPVHLSVGRPWLRDGQL